jgi:hypothetical protein
MMQMHSHGHGAHHAQGGSPPPALPDGPAGWAGRHQAVGQAGGWRQLLREPIDQRAWDHQFSREVSSETLLSRSVALTPGVFADLLAIGRQSPWWSLEPSRRRMLGSLAQQQHHAFEVIAKAWAAQQRWLIGLQMSDLRDIQTELASRMTAAGNWPKKEQLEWRAKKNKALDSLDDSRLAGERLFSELRLLLQLGQAALEFSQTKLQTPVLWTLGAKEVDPRTLQERAQAAVQKTPGPSGPPLDLWRSYQGTLLALEQAAAAGRSLDREKDIAELAANLLSEALLEHNGMFISTFALLDQQIEKLKADQEVIQATSTLLQQQSALRRTSVQTLLLEADFGVRS